MGKPGIEDAILYNESDTAAYAGQFVKARELTRRAADSAERNDERETAAYYEAYGALHEVLVGNTSLARQQAQAALALSNGRLVEAISAIALGLIGDFAQAMRLASDLSRRFPKDTIVQLEYLPMVRAAAILGGGNASKEADKAVEALAAAAPYELGSIALYPVYSSTPGLPASYLRGEAYLAAHQGAAAAAEFQKILDHPGVVLNELIGALAHLGLGRACALEAGIAIVPGFSRAHAAPKGSATSAHAASKGGATSEALAKAGTAYQDFFALWKDADPDIPILKQAKAEYAELK
jgi:eukaryotic-like serine/threonine-protein kinase